MDGGGATNGGNRKQTISTNSSDLGDVPPIEVTSPNQTTIDQGYAALTKKWQEIEERRAKEKDNYIRSLKVGTEQHNPRVFFDIAVGDVPAGRVVVELYKDVVPKLAENFRLLMTGEKGVDSVSGTRLDYCESTFHIVNRAEGYIRGGLLGLGMASLSAVTGAPNLKDENFKLRHDQRGIVSMCSRGPNTNGSEFNITLGKAHHMDFYHVVVGKIIDGIAALEMIEAVAVTKTLVPTVPIQILFCGQLNAVV
eukprot:PhF_6_TR7303/c0_g1_i1/m.10927/K05864/PPID, CYPD; peptidyl-prolyl isomerase D